MKSKVEQFRYIQIVKTTGLDKFIDPCSTLSILSKEKQNKTKQNKNKNKTNSAHMN